MWVSSCVIFIGRRLSNSLFCNMREMLIEIFRLWVGNWQAYWSNLIKKMDPKLTMSRQYFLIYESRDFMKSRLIHHGIFEDHSKLNWLIYQQIGSIGCRQMVGFFSEHEFHFLSNSWVRIVTSEFAYFLHILAL